MKYLRFINAKGEKVYGLLENDRVIEITDAPYNKYEKTGDEYAYAEVKVVAPSDPNTIMCVGTNYMDHIKEANEKMPVSIPVPKQPLLFGKGRNTIADPEQGIIYPTPVERVDYEAELGIIIGKRAYQVRKEEALDYVAGYTCVNDVSARNYQWDDGQWTRGKGLDGFCPFGPIVTDEIDPFNTAVIARVNGEVHQNGTTADMIFDVRELIAYITEWITLEPGDLIATGTPAGVGPVKVGDVMEIEVGGVGVLRNTMIAAK